MYIGFDGCRFEFLGCNAVARFQRLRAGRYIKNVKGSHANMPIDLRISSMILKDVMLLEKVVRLEHPSNEDLPWNDAFEELAVLKISDLHLAFLPDGPLLGKFHTNPPGRQTNPLFLVHRHARIVSLQQGNIHPLSLCILKILLARLDLPCGLF